MNFFKKYFGPSTLVTAAFIGPGTLTVCTLAGADFGYSLLWVLALAIGATIVLQEMAARIGLLTQSGLGEALRSNISSRVVRIASLLLVFVAIIIGNGAYEAGNLSGAALGISSLAGEDYPWSLFIGLLAFAVLFVGKQKFIEYVLIALVLLMSIVFLVTAIVVKPDIIELASGFVPTFSGSNSLAILGLIGTTIVPYNLFLHASVVRQKWKTASDLPALRTENAISIALGGLISIAIVVTSAATLFGRQVDGVSGMASQLEPLLGSWSTVFLSVGLFAAGISSSITAPLAASFAAVGIFGWQENGIQNWRFKVVWICVLLIGIVFSMLGYKPISIIQVAQIANGILLPIIVAFLIYLCNQRALLGSFTNSKTQNVLAFLVVLICLVISFRSFNSVFQMI